jgi:hypothetical protein
MLAGLLAANVEPAPLLARPITFDLSPRSPRQASASSQAEQGAAPGIHVQVSGSAALFWHSSKHLGGKKEQSKCLLIEESCELVTCWLSGDRGC